MRSPGPYLLARRVRLYARWYAFRCRHGWHPKDYREVRKGWTHVHRQNPVWTDQTYCDFCGAVLDDRSATTNPNYTTWAPNVYRSGPPGPATKGSP